MIYFLNKINKNIYKKKKISYLKRLGIKFFVKRKIEKYNFYLNRKKETMLMLQIYFRKVYIF